MTAMHADTRGWGRRVGIRGAALLLAVALIAPAWMLNAAALAEGEYYLVGASGSDVIIADTVAISVRDGRKYLELNGRPFGAVELLEHSNGTRKPLSRFVAVFPPRQTESSDGAFVTIVLDGRMEADGEITCTLVYVSDANQYSSKYRMLPTGALYEQQKAEVPQESKRSEPDVESGSFSQGESSQRAAGEGKMPTTRYTAEELRKHLQEYNMEAIRQGFPALPIELTPEQEAELLIEFR